jgi:hypothetical protein
MPSFSMCSTSSAVALYPPSVDIPESLEGSVPLGDVTSKSYSVMPIYGSGSLSYSIKSVRFYMKLNAKYTAMYENWSPTLASTWNIAESNYYKAANEEKGLYIGSYTPNNSQEYAFIEGGFYYSVLEGLGTNFSDTYSQYNYVLNCLVETGTAHFTLFAYVTLENEKNYTFSCPMYVNVSAVSYVPVDYSDLSLSTSSIVF